jgi:hypothetical protein
MGHSYRFMPKSSGQLSSTDWTFETFRAKSLYVAADRGGYVLMTDIADFFQRIYLHRFENAIDVATSKRDHARALTKLLPGWNQSVSYGLPVGPACCDSWRT